MVVIMLRSESSTTADTSTLCSLLVLREWVPTTSPLARLVPRLLPRKNRRGIQGLYCALFVFKLFFGMSSLAAVQADGYYYPPNWSPSKGNKDKFHHVRSLVCF